MSAITITFDNQKTMLIPSGTTLQELSRMKGAVDNPSPVVAALVNDKTCELSTPLFESCRVMFLHFSDMDGFRIFQRTLTMLFLRAASEVLGEDAQIEVKFALKNALYCEIVNCAAFEADRVGKTGAIRSRMMELVEHPEPIIQMLVDIPDAIENARQLHMPARERLFNYRRFSVAHLYKFGKYVDYLYGFMFSDSSGLDKFDLTPYEHGVAIIMPARTYPHTMTPLRDTPKIMKVFDRSKEWSEILHVGDIGALNEQITRGTIRQLIYTAEAFHAKEIANIAEDIVTRPDAKIILIAGPSSSGKTTFAKRLCIQLRAEGKVPHLISVDNYFRPRAEAPIGEDGKPDLEALECVDLELFQHDLQALLDGERIEKPVYNFKSGLREYHGETMTCTGNELIVCEGIHCLNEKLTESIAMKNKYRIYISALTQLSIDEHNRIPTTDGRLLRRMVRDHLYRGASAAHTISGWESVRRGEDRNIFPFQEEADYMFNSALPYEMAVIKQFAEPLLFGIEKGTREYSEARRLIKFLDYFQGLSSEEVPQTSLLREFIGGSVFENMEES